MLLSSPYMFQYPASSSLFRARQTEDKAVQSDGKCQRLRDDLSCFNLTFFDLISKTLRIINFTDTRTKSIAAFLSCIQYSSRCGTSLKTMRICKKTLNYIKSLVNISLWVPVISSRIFGFISFSQLRFARGSKVFAAVWVQLRGFVKFLRTNTQIKPLGDG